jgi:outer membrane protein OmpA-like peptidoglycan-associated protein
MRVQWFLPLVAVTVLVGCQTNRGVHEIPMSRDYHGVEFFDIDEAEAMVMKAHRVGAQHYSAFKYNSAVRYLKMAKASKAENDKKGTWDYAKLAHDYAEQAIAGGSGIPDRGPFTQYADKEACMADFTRVKGKLMELDPEKAALVAPVLYADATYQLSRAEHELIEVRHWPQAGPRIPKAEADIDTIWIQDVDGDGIVDMKDGAPWAPEDKDGFEDGDGVPDPDNDQDKVLDADDLKINDPETHNNWHDYDGVPDEPAKLDTIYYASGSAAISSETKGYLRGLVHIVQEWPKITLHVKGHTDSVAGEPANKDLSQRRAETVQAYLVSRGAPADRVKVSFYGESMPVNENKTAAEKAKNRRVELVLE